MTSPTVWKIPTTQFGPEQAAARKVVRGGEAMSAQIPIPSRPYVGLQPVTIDGHALYAFSEALNRRLDELEQRFAAPRRLRSLAERKTWKPLPRKPR